MTYQSVYWSILKTHHEYVVSQCSLVRISMGGRERGGGSGGEREWGREGGSGGGREGEGRKGGEGEEGRGEREVKKGGTRERGGKGKGRGIQEGMRYKRELGGREMR